MEPGLQSRSPGGGAGSRSCPQPCCTAHPMRFGKGVAGWRCRAPVPGSCLQPVTFLACSQSSCRLGLPAPCPAGHLLPGALCLRPAAAPSHPSPGKAPVPSAPSRVGTQIPHHHIGRQFPACTAMPLLGQPWPSRGCVHCAGNQQGLFRGPGASVAQPVKLPPAELCPLSPSYSASGPA